MSLQIKLLRKKKKKQVEWDGQRKDSSGSTQMGHNSTNQKAETETMTIGGAAELFGDPFKPSANKKAAQNANNHA